LPGVFSLCPGNRIKYLLIDDWRLEAKDGCGISQRCISRNGESRKSSVTDTVQSYRSGEVFFVARPLIDELSPKVRVSNLVRNVAGEDVGICTQQALHADVCGIAERIGYRNSVGACGRSAAIVDVIARS